MNSIYKAYLDKLELSVGKPDLQFLSNIVTAHLRKVPFENVSKIYYYHKYNIRTIPDFHLYVEGLVKNNFGGTCYSNNYYLNQLLNHLGFDAKLCGADMNSPDAHLTNIVTIDEREYLVDVGYAAPFLNPIPLDLNKNYEVELGNDKYVILPRNEEGHSQLQLYREGELKHGYMVKSNSKKIEEFNKQIENSFKETSTFFNTILLVKFSSNSATIIHNFSVIEYEGSESIKTTLSGKDELAEEIEKRFGISKEITEYSLSHINNFNDAWD